MQDWQEEPLSFSEILDVTFRIIKENFSKLFLIMLIFMGPIYLLQGIAKLTGGLSILAEPSRGAGLTSFLGSLTQAGLQGTNVNFPGSELLLILVSTLLLVFIAAPMAYASLIIATQQIRQTGTVDIASTIKQAFARFWPLLGGSMLYFVIIYGLILGVSLILGIYLAVSGMLGMFTSQAAVAPANLGVNILVIILLALASFLGFIYLITRWSFFFVAIVFEKVSPGLGKSWRLTRGNFWRLFGLYLVVAILNMIIAAILEAVITFVLGNSLLAFLLNSLVAMAVTMMPFVAYAVTYFDLRIRNEAVDLKGMLADYPANTSLNPTAVYTPNHAALPSEQAMEPKYPTENRELGTTDRQPGTEDREVRTDDRTDDRT